MEKFSVNHNSKKYEIIINTSEKDEITLGELANAIQKQCDVPVNKQKLICKGKTLSGFSRTLKELGISSKEKFLLIGKKHNDAEMLQLESIKKIDEYVAQNLRKKSEEKKLELDGIEKGFLDKDKGKESLDKLSKHFTALSEGFMKQLENLDDLTIEKDFLEGREKRKALVIKIQNYLKENDIEEERITKISAKL